MNNLIDKRLLILSNVHRVHDCRVYHREACFAAKQGMRVAIFAIGDDFVSDDIEIEAYEAPKSRLRRFFLGWWLAYRACLHRADICHFHDPEMLLPMTVFSLLTRTPVVYDCHENVVDSIQYKPHIPKLLRPFIATVVYTVQWTCARLLGSVVIATEEQLEMFPDSIHHLVIRNFPPLFIQEEVNYSAERPFDIVHCGTFSPERGSHVMLEMMRILVHDLGHRDCRLLLVGVSEEQLGPDIQQFIRDNDLRDNLVLQEAVPLHEVPHFLSQAKIGLMCHQETKQYSYGVASKVFDYMASGLAIVGGQADFDQEYAPETTVKIYVDQIKPREYALAVQHLLEQDSLREDMGRNARNLYEEKYTAELQADNLLKFYCETIGKKAA